MALEPIHKAGTCQYNLCRKSIEKLRYGGESMKKKATIGIIASTFLIAALVIGLTSGSAEATKHEKSEAKSGSAWLGVYMQDIDKELAEAFDLETEDGVLVDDVIDDSPADEAGIRRGDVITGIGESEVNKPQDLKDAVRALEPGDEVTIHVFRDGEKKGFSVELGSDKLTEYHLDFDSPHGTWHDRSGNRFFGTIFMGDEGGYLGVSTIELSDQLAEYFSVDDGVLVSEVESDSPAEKAGLKAGDIITAVDDNEIDSPSRLREAIRKHSEGDEVLIAVVRKGDKQEFTAKLDETTDSNTFGNNQFFQQFHNMPGMDQFRMFKFDTDEDFDREDMDDIREELQNLKKELNELREKLD